MDRINRRELLRAGLAVCVVGRMGGDSMAEATEQAPKAQQTAPDRGPQLDSALVKEFVIAGHGNLEKVRQMLEQQPALLNAAWDWGSGDWETALGGAGHMGNRKIALFLLEKGARMDIFAAAMLGRLEIVQAMLEAFPNLAVSHGPHGIPLAAHAKAGGEQAMAVSRYLEALKPSHA